jgi:tellurite resistance protein TerC
METISAFLLADWLSKPVWMWLAFIGIIIALLIFDLGVLHKDEKEIEVKESLVLSAGYIGLGLAFGVWVWWYLGATAGMNYFTGFAVEKPLRWTMSSSSR